jgi:hypothetical protein
VTTTILVAIVGGIGVAWFLVGALFDRGRS